jgi:hypothetical protein
VLNYFGHFSICSSASTFLLPERVCGYFCNSARSTRWMRLLVIMRPSKTCLLFNFSISWQWRVSLFHIKLLTRGEARSKSDLHPVESSYVFSGKKLSSQGSREDFARFNCKIEAKNTFAAATFRLKKFSALFFVPDGRKE